MVGTVRKRGDSQPAGADVASATAGQSLGSGSSRLASSQSHTSVVAVQGAEHMTAAIGKTGSYRTSRVNGVSGPYLRIEDKENEFDCL